MDLWGGAALVLSVITSSYLLLSLPWLFSFLQVPAGRVQHAGLEIVAENGEARRTNLIQSSTIVSPFVNFLPASGNSLAKDKPVFESDMGSAHPSLPWLVAFSPTFKTLVPRNEVIPADTCLLSSLRPSSAHLWRPTLRHNYQKTL